MILTNYERDEKFKQINALISEIWLDENNREGATNGAIRERLAMASECLAVAHRAIGIRQGVIQV